MNSATEPAPTAIAYAPEQCKNPPVVSRRFVTHLDVATNLFEERPLPITEKVQAQGRFDHRIMKQRWQFRVEIKGEVPRPKGRLTHSPLLIRSAQGKPLRGGEISRRDQQRAGRRAFRYQ